MKLPGISRRVLALLVVIVPLTSLFLYVAIYYGPLASVPVTRTTVQSRSIAPGLFGIGTVQARYTQQIGPTLTGRLLHLEVDVGDSVVAGQVLGEMDPVDLDERLNAQKAAIRKSQAIEMQAVTRRDFAATQAERYAKLFVVKGVSEESAAIKRQELVEAEAALEVAKEENVRLRAELEAMRAQRRYFKLISPGNGIVIARNADPGTTLTAGQAVIEIMDPASLWVDARFDQGGSQGLEANLSAQIVLRSRRQENQSGKVFRIEPRADSVTEETLARIVFQSPPSPLPPVGELAEVTVQLPQQAVSPAIPNAALRTVNGRQGVWKLRNGRLTFAPLVLGQSDLDGWIQVRAGLAPGEQIVLYSEKILTARTRVHVVDHLAGVTP
jgi:HlyD family secretion protein